VINFTLGSMGAGYYVWTRLGVLLAGGTEAAGGAANAGRVAVGLILAGFFALLFEAGNPLKSYLTILNVRHSWMSRELWLALIFIGVIGLDAFFPDPVIRSMAGATAFLFIVSQAFIVYKSRAMVSWNVWPILPLFVLTGLSSGFGLFLLIERQEDLGPVLLVGGATWLLCLGAVLFYILGFDRQNDDFRAGTQSLRTVGALGMGSGVGLLLPAVLVAAVAGGLITTFTGAALTVAGAGAVLGAGLRNRDIITKAGYFRRIKIGL